jgi:ribulose-phosphate 3-epimerase
MEIIPAIMPKDFEEITVKAEEVYRFVKTIQIDIMDGKLTHSVSWPYLPEQAESFDKLASGEVGLPFWKDVDYEADLMVQNAEEDFGFWVNAGFHRVIVHIESTSKFRKIFEEWKGVVEIGVAINIDTDNSQLAPLIEDGLDFVQFMGIATIGYQGSPFDSRVIQKIESLRKTYPNIIISVDGGVNLKNAPLLRKAGANRLVAGSAIFQSESIEMAIGEFKNLTETKT